MKMYKDGNCCDAERSQVEDLKKAGWSTDVPAPEPAAGEKKAPAKPAVKK